MAGKWASAQSIEDITWQMRWADLQRSNNRALIDIFANGGAPYTERQVKENNIFVNYNSLELTKLLMDARGQYENAFFSPSQYFAVKVDRGAKHRRDEWSEIITACLRKAMKRGHSALRYKENLRNVFAQVVMHGPGPMLWRDQQHWCPDMVAMGDLMLPSLTELTMENVDYFAVYRRYTAYQLWRQTHGPKVDPAWNIEVADKCIEWALKQYGQTFQNEYLYNPERMQEDFKSDGGIYNSDAVPTINCWDFYSRETDGDESSWKRRIVLDAPTIGESGVSSLTKNLLGERDQFLYDAGDRNYAVKLSQIIHFQFGDGSMVAPFRYHSIRSLGWLLYSICHVQNRLRCALTESAFEALLQYFRVTNADDAQRAIKINLINRGVIPDGVNFVRPEERWRVDAALVESVMALNAKSIADNSTAYTKNFGEDLQRKEKTATQVTAEVNAASALLGSMLNQAYSYSEFQYQEIGRRFSIPNSSDPDVRQFRVDCLKQGVPEEIIDADCWEISAERIMGAGNKQLAIGQAQAIMQQYPLLDPNAQRVAMRKYMFAITGDAAATAELAPAEPVLVTKSVHDAQVSVATLLAAQPMGLVEGVNHAEYAGVLLGALNVEIEKVNARDGVATAGQLAGFQNLAGMSIEGQPVEGNGAANHIAILAQDPTTKQIVKQLGDILGKLMNELRAMAQRLQEQQGQTQAAQPELSPEDAVKLKGQLLIAKTKAANMAESHAQRSQQRAESHRQKLSEAQQRDNLANANAIRKTQVDEAATDLKTAAEIQRQSEEPPTGQPS